MVDQDEQWNCIGSKYDEYSRTATLKKGERYSIARMVGDLNGERVLDLACGSGFHTRLLKQLGAGLVIGVDISPEMIRLANQQEQAEPLGITYQIHDALELPNLGPFDLITGIWLFCYPKSKDEMLRMFQKVYDNLGTEGRFVAYAANPAFTLSHSNFTKYGFTIKSEILDGDRYEFHAEFMTDPPTPVSAYRWNQPTYEWAIKEAGFREFAWHPSEVSPEDLERHGKEYWQDWYNNCWCIGLVCNK